MPPTKAVSGQLSEAGPVRGVIGVLASNGADHARIGQELCDRYKGSYDLVIWTTPEAALTALRNLRGGTVPVVLLVACQRHPDDGTTFLGDAGSIHPQAKRAIVVRWGDFKARRRMVRALIRGDLDRWLWLPEHSADEEFHLAVTDLLASWASGHEVATEAVQIIGDRRSERGLQLRELMNRFNVPFGFYDGGSGAGKGFESHGLVEAEFPVVVFGFRPGSPALEDPSDQALADAFGVNDPIEPDRVFDLAIIGAGPAGLAAAVTGPQRVSRHLWSSPMGRADKLGQPLSSGIIPASPPASAEGASRWPCTARLGDSGPASCSCARRRALTRQRAVSCASDSPTESAYEPRRLLPLPVSTTPDSMSPESTSFSAGASSTRRP